MASSAPQTSQLLLIRRHNADTEATITDLPVDEVRTAYPDGNVLVDVAFSSLNYKDALAVTGTGDIIRGNFPFVPGIDLAGTVRESDSEAYSPGDKVIQTGWGLGETHWGGFSSHQVVRDDHLVALPQHLSLRGAMTLGTAGLTAMLAVLALEEQDIDPADGSILVTGASGGVGSIAVHLLSQMDFEVAAVTGKSHAHDYLTILGADHLLNREEIQSDDRPRLASARWSGAIDVVGGSLLEAIIPAIDQHGCIAVCGNAGGIDFSTNVFPFILRGIALCGIDSNTCPQSRRERAWKRLARTTSTSALDTILSKTISLDEIPAESQRMIRGESLGRIVVDVIR